MATTSVTPPSDQARRAPDPKSGPRGSLSQSLQSRGWGPRLGYVLLLLVLGYLIVLPLIRLQSLAFEDGAAGLQVAVRESRYRPGDLDDSPARAGLPRDRDGARHGARLRQQSPPSALRVLEGDSGTAHRDARGGQHLRVGLPALAGSRLPQRAPAAPTLVELPRLGAGRCLHHDLDHHPHRFRTDVFRLPLRQCGHGQHQRRAPRGGAGEWIVHGRGVLPDRAAPAAPLADLRRLAWRSCWVSVSSPARCCSARTPASKF